MSEMQVYEDLHFEIERRAFFMWCSQGKPDGEEEVDFGLGKKKLCEYHWLIASLEAKMESRSFIRRIEPVRCSPFVPLFYTPLKDFDPKKGILTKYGQKLLKEKEAKLTPVDEPPCDEAVIIEITKRYD